MTSKQDKNIFFRQLFDRESCTYTYLLACKCNNEAILIDPVIELADRDAQLVRELGFKLKYVMNTHMHADHITGTGRLKKLAPGAQSIIGKDACADADIKVEDGGKILFGDLQLDVMATPGHTEGCLTYVFHPLKMCFTGDALLIRGCGRTDFQGGSSDTLYESVHRRIFTLGDDYKVYPAHDYKGQTCSTVGEEKKYNPRLTKPKQEFGAIMAGLNLAYPKKIDVALPANRVCGLHNIPDEIAAQFKDNFAPIKPLKPLTPHPSATACDSEPEPATEPEPAPDAEPAAEPAPSSAPSSASRRRMRRGESSPCGCPGHRGKASSSGRSCSGGRKSTRRSRSGRRRQ